jgi:hypothetical protein
MHERFKIFAFLPQTHLPRHRKTRMPLAADFAGR